MTICEEREAHATGFGLAYGAKNGVQVIKCLDCGEVVPLQWSTDDDAALLRTSPIANEPPNPPSTNEERP